MGFQAIRSNSGGNRDAQTNTVVQQRGADVSVPGGR